MLGLHKTLIFVIFFKHGAFDLFFLFSFQTDTRTETIVTQSPALLSAAPGDKVTITCKASQDIDDDMHWYQQKPGETPMLIIREATTRLSGVPSRFTGSGYGTDFTLTINNMETEDAAYYFCQQDDNLPLTVIYFVTKTPKCLQWYYLSCY